MPVLRCHFSFRRRHTWSPDLVYGCCEWEDERPDYPVWQAAVMHTSVVWDCIALISLLRNHTLNIQCRVRGTRTKCAPVIRTVLTVWNSNAEIKQNQIKLHTGKINNRCFSGIVAPSVLILRKGSRTPKNTLPIVCAPW